MNSVNPIAYAQLLKQEADNMLASGVLALLEKHGCVVFSGSYDLDLLAWRDIDLYLVIDDENSLNETLCKIAADVLVRPDLLRIDFMRKYHEKTPGCPNGTVVGLKLGESWEQFWKFDCWITSHAERDRNARLQQRIKAALTPQTRELILRIKHKILTKEGRTPSMSGFYLYQAVLFENLRDEGDILEYLRAQDIKIL